MRIRDSEDIIAKDCSGDDITIFETLSAIQKYKKDSIYACSFSFPFTKDFCSNHYKKGGVQAAFFWAAF